MNHVKADELRGPVSYCVSSFHGSQSSCDIAPYGLPCSNEIFQYTLELKVLACSFTSDFNYID